MKIFSFPVLAALPLLFVFGHQNVEAKPVDKTTAQRYLTSAFQHEERGELTAAIEDYTKFIGLVPSNGPIYILRGGAYKHMGNFEQAIADGTLAIAQDSNEANSYFFRGTVYQESENYEAALKDFNRAIELNPRNQACLCCRGEVKRVIKDFSGAKADFLEAIRLAPKDSSGYWFLGYARVDEGDFAGAVIEFNRGVDLDRKDAKSYRTRAEFFFVVGDYASALKDFEKSRQIEPKKKLSNNFHVFLMQRRLGLPADLKMLSKEVRKMPEDWTKTVGRFLIGEMNETELLGRANEGDAKTIRDHSCDAFFYIGSIHLVNGNKEVARSFYAKAVATNMKGSVEWSFSKAELARLTGLN